MRNSHTHYSKKINVWAEVIGVQICCPILIDGNLTARNKLSMIREEVVLVLANLFPNVIDPSLPNQMTGQHSIIP